jgi:hypothetical protein
MRLIDKCFAGGVILGVLLVVALPLACATGIGLNIYKLTQCDFEAPYKAEIIRGIGVFPVVPIGIVAGYLHIDDTPRKNRPPVASFKVVPVN